MTDAEPARDIRLGKTLQFMQLVWELGHSLQSLSKRMEAALGVSSGQRLTLRLVGRAPGISAGELAAALRIHPSTLTGILRRLEDRKALRRRQDPVDARCSRFELTSIGRKLDQARSPTVEAAVRRTLLRADPADVEATRGFLRTLIEELEREAQT